MTKYQQLEKLASLGYRVVPFGAPDALLSRFPTEKIIVSCYTEEAFSADFARQRYPGSPFHLYVAGESTYHYFRDNKCYNIGSDGTIWSIADLAYRVLPQPYRVEFKGGFAVGLYIERFPDEE